MLGVSYVALMSAILLSITRLRPESWPWFVISLAALAICLLGFGLLLGSVFKSATQLNTWSGLLLIPAVVPASLIGLGISDWVDRIAGLTPTGAGMKLLTDAFTDPRVYDDPLRTLMVVIVWAVIFYGLLLWQLSRRRA
jgi:ABC-type transport system involved in multi-copper enzyme maturation permease subunit